MILSQTTDCVSKFGDIKAIEMLGKAGFDAIDFNMLSLNNASSLLTTPNYKAYIDTLCKCAEKNNIIFNQAHGLTGVNHPDATTAYNLLVQRNIRALEIASIMGIKTMIVHPLDTVNYIGNEALCFEKNINYFRALLPFAEKYGVKLACENMWYYDKKRGVRTGSVCSNPFEHAYYVDEMNSEMFVACLDVGHTSIAGREPQDSIRVLGNRLQAVHIHDNDYLDDMHTLPGLSELNWTEIMKALADVDYSGDFTFETEHFFDSLESEEEVQTGLKLAELIGRKLIRQFENFKKQAQV